MIINTNKLEKKTHTQNNNKITRGQYTKLKNKTKKKKEKHILMLNNASEPVLVTSLPVIDVTERRSKNAGKLANLKPRLMTSRAVFYRAELAVAKTLWIGEPDTNLSLTLKQFFPRFSS